jgi:hypothetical protein
MHFIFKKYVKTDKILKSALYIVTCVYTVTLQSYDVTIGKRKRLYVNYHTFQGNHQNHNLITILYIYIFSNNPPLMHFV